jgi:transposase
MRGLIAEFGHVLPNGAEQLRRQVPGLLKHLPPQVMRCVRDLLEHAERQRCKVLEYEREIRLSVRHNELARRQFSAWLGLVPRQYSTGGKTRLGHITKRGDPYLRTLLVMGARSVLQRAYREADPLSRWALALQQRRGYHRACVAIAAKNARIAWALLAKEAAAA